MEKMAKYEFLSAEWLQELRSQLEQGLEGEDLTGIDYTMCEEYTGVPAHLRPRGGDTVGFYFRVRDGKVEVGDPPIQDANIRVLADYATVHPNAMLTHAEISAATGLDPQELMAKNAAAGTVQVFGQLSDMPPVIANVHLHDRLAPRTC
jgi:hypothetical protein